VEEVEDCDGTIHLDGQAVVIRTAADEIRESVAAVEVTLYPDDVALATLDHGAWLQLRAVGDQQALRAQLNSLGGGSMQMLNRGRRRSTPAASMPPLTFVVRHPRGYVGIRGDRVVTRWYGLWESLLSRGQESWISVAAATVHHQAATDNQVGYLRVCFHGETWLDWIEANDDFVAHDFASEVARLRRRALGDPEPD